MVRAILYARVSTKGQEEGGTSLKTQLDHCRKAAQQRSYTVVREISDGYTGATLARPGMTEVRDMVRHGLADVVLAYAVDRLGRDDADLAILGREFERRRVKLDFVVMPNTGSREFFYLFGFARMLAEAERHDILERTQRGKREILASGNVLPTGHPPYGFAYRKGPAKHECHLIPVPDELEHVLAMYRWLIEEHISLEQIAQRLNARGIPTHTRRGRWTPTTVRRIIANPVYAGTFYYYRTDQSKDPDEKRQCVARPREEWLAVPIEPVIDDATFQRAQAQLTRNKQLAKRRTKADYQLRGMVICGTCGHAMRGKTHRGQQFYLCSSRAVTQRHLPLAERCPNKHLYPAALIDQLIWEQVMMAVNDPTLVEDLLRHRQAELTDHSAALASLVKQENALNHRLEAQRDAFEAGEYDLATLQQRSAPTKEKLAVVQAERQRLLTEQAQREAALTNIASVQALCRHYSHKLADASPETRRQFLLTSHTRIALSPGVITMSWVLGEADADLARLDRLVAPLGEPADQPQDTPGFWFAPQSGASDNLFSREQHDKVQVGLCVPLAMTVPLAA